MSALVDRLVDEGLRMEDHPGIIFRPGATGRRAGLVRGPDVWDVIGLLRRLEPRGDGAIADAASWLDLPKRDVRSAIEYYAAFPEEIDQADRRERAQHGARSQRGGGPAATAVVRLVLDEMFPPAIAVALRDRGHDVIAVVEDPSLRGLSDEELFAWAQDCRRTLVTENVEDYLPIDRRLRTRGEDHQGPIMTSHKTFSRHRQRFIGEVAGALNALLEEIPTVGASFNGCERTSKASGQLIDLLTPRRSRSC